MQLIAPPPASSKGRWIVVPESSNRLVTASFRRGQERRRKIFVGLLTATSVSFLMSLFSGGMWGITVAIASSLFAYVVLLVGVKRRSDDIRSKIQPLHRPQAERRPELQPARAGGGAR